MRRRLALRAREAEPFEGMGQPVVFDVQDLDSSVFAGYAQKRIAFYQRIGADIRRRLVAALGDDGDDDVVTALEMVYAGALVRAGMGYGSYSDMADAIESAARLIVR